VALHECRVSRRIPVARRLGCFTEARKIDEMNSMCVLEKIPEIAQRFATGSPAVQKDDVLTAVAEDLGNQRCAICIEMFNTPVVVSKGGDFPWTWLKGREI